MSNAENWYEVIEHKNYLFIIREKLDEVDPRFLTVYTNIYLILGSQKALLVDTGCGLFPLKPIIDKLVENRELLVFNTHSHFDHRGANDEFGTIYIHESEAKNASMPFDISILKDSPKDVVNVYNDKNSFKYPPPKEVKSLKEGDTFDLGDIAVEVIHTPGHSIGSISLLTNKGELFTGDTAHYGSMYLPKRKQFPIILSSISKLKDLFDANKVQEIYPSHERYPVGRELLDELYSGISNIEKNWDTKQKDRFLHAWILEDSNFKYVI